MTRENIENLKRGLAGIVSILVWWAGINFSVIGFNFQIENFAWIGWVLGFSVTVTELVFNSQLTYKATNITIYILGIAAYIYDAATNFNGVLVSQGISDLSKVQMSFSTVFAFFLSIYLSILPETLGIYALGGIISNYGDFARNLLGLADKEPGNRQQNTSNNNQPKKPLPPIQPPPKNQQQKGNPNQNNSYPRNPYPVNLEKEYRDQ